MDVVLNSVQRAEEMVLSAAEASGAGARDSNAVEALFRAHYPRLAGMLSRLTGDPGQAEEIAADVFHKLSRRPALLAGADLTAWMYRVATNAGLDALRMNSRRRTREQSAANGIHAVSRDNALEDMLREERQTRVREVLGSMKPRDAQMLLLRSGGMAYREVAQTLGIHPGSVGTLLARAEAEFERRYRTRYGDEV